MWGSLKNLVMFAYAHQKVFQGRWESLYIMFSEPWACKEQMTNELHF